MSALKFHKLSVETIPDSMCKCGHPKSKHGSMTCTTPDRMVRLPNDGSCCDGRCSCRQFTWTRFLTPSGMGKKKQLARA